MPRKPSCTCGDCGRCRKRIAAREAYQSMTPAQRREWVGKRDAAKVRAADRARHERDRERRIAAMAERQRTPEGAAQHNERVRRWRAENPEKVQAHNAVAYALRTGRLEKGPCESAGEGCRGRIHAHHDDYAKPLDVRWLCDHHHKAAHEAHEEIIHG